MKRLFYAVLAGLALSQSVQAAYPLPAHEAFSTNYANNARLRDIASLDAGNSAGSGSNLTNAWVAGLSYPGLVASTNTGGVIANGSPSSGRDAGFQLSPAFTFSAGNSALYASFLLKIQTPPTTTNLIALLAAGTGGGSTPVAGVYLDQNNKLWISKNSAVPGTNTPGALVVGETNLVVVRYKYNAVEADEVALWLNPLAVTLGVAEENIPAPTLSTTVGTDASAVAAFDFGHRTTSGTAVGATGFKSLDEIRVATNWAGVTPATPGPASTNQPYITQTFLSNGGLVLRGTNGNPDGVYRVVSSGDVGLPLWQWQLVTTNTFDAGGNFDTTNPVSPGDVQRFYRLWVGGQIAPLPVGPSFILQPSNLVVIVGQPAVFYSAADGTGPLHYQWFFNPGAPLLDETNTIFAIASVTTNDAGAYSVRVTNSLGSIISTQATLTVLVPPTFTLQPTNLTVSAGQAVTFNVLASGTESLNYQWFFNTNSLLAGMTNATLALTNVQFSQMGTYSVRVTNLAGSVTSSLAVLTVNAPPTISDEPDSLVLLAGQPANFSVTATGSAPLRYQWYFNTNTPLLDATNAVLVLNTVQTNDAGGYSITVTNAFGAVTSVVASLTVNPSSGLPDFSMIGFATLDGFATNGTLRVGGTTGGEGGPIVVASNLVWLVNYAQRSNQPLRVLITADIDCSSLNNNNSAPGYQTGRINVNNDKTIYSTNGATISRGTLNIGGKSNVIVRNLKFRDMFVFDPSGAYDTYGWDYVVVTGSHHVWVDHCDFERVYDGFVDVVNGSDYVTVSWNVFRSQKKCSLVGNSDSNGAEDRSHLNVTYHHNWFSNVDERTPRMRFGNAHVFNQYTDNRTATNNTGKLIQATAEAAVLVENVYITHATNAYPTVFVNGGLTGNYLKVTGSIITNSPGQQGFQQLNAATFSFNAPWVTNAPPYPYFLDAVADVPSVVTNWSGVGKITSF